MKAGSGRLGSACKGRGQRQAPRKSLLEYAPTTSGSTTCGSAKVTRLKQGGRVHTPYSKVRGWGAAASRDAQPNLFRRCFTTVPNLGRLKTTPGVTVQTVCVDVWGEWNRTTLGQGVNRQASGNLPDEGDAIPSRPASPHRSAKHVSDRTTGGMERSVQVSRLPGSGARSVGRESDQAERHNLRGMDGQHSAGSRRARKPPLAANTKVLTDAWNYVKVVVGSKLRAEVRMKSGHSVWAKYREAGEVIDLDGLFSDYWSSHNREFTVMSQSLSPINPHRSD